MPHHTAIEIIGPIIGVITALLIPLAIVLVVLRHRRRLTELKLKTLADLAQRGTEVPYALLLGTPRPHTDSDLRIGMVLASTGIGALLFAFTLPEHPAWGVGLLPLFAGLGFLVTWKVGRARAASGNGG